MLPKGAREAVAGLECIVLRERFVPYRVPYRAGISIVRAINMP